MFIEASSLYCQPRRGEMSCAHFYAAPNGARRSASASLTINITPYGVTERETLRVSYRCAELNQV